MTGYGIDDFLKEKKQKEDVRQTIDEPHCPECGSPMKYDTGDGCVHEPKWYCDKPGCHYNDRCFMTVATAIAMMDYRQGKSEEEITQHIKAIKGGK